MIFYEKNSKKTLAPLLIIFAFVILFTMILISSQKMRLDAQRKKNFDQLQMTMSSESEKSSFRLNSAQNESDESDGKNNNIPDYRNSLRMALDYFNQKEYEKAEDVLTVLALYYPYAVDVTSLLGEVCSQLKKYSDAEHCYSKQLLFYPDEPSILNNLAIMQMELGKLKEAIQNITKAVQNMPDRGEFWLNQSIILEKIGEHPKAVESFKHAISLLNDKIQMLSSSQIFDPIRNDPEIKKILHDMQSQKMTEQQDKKI